MNFENLSEEAKKKIEEKVINISGNIQEMENTLKEYGLSAKKNIPFPENLRINLPNGYFRTLEMFIKEYKLYLIMDKALKMNLSYHLQYTDFLNLLLNRTQLGTNGLSIGTTFRKNSIILVITIIEGIIAGLVETTYVKCNRCENFKSCSKKLVISIREKKRKDLKRATFYTLISLLKDSDFINKKYEETLLDLKEYRDRVHIQHKKDGKVYNDYTQGEYDVNEYNNAILALRNLKTVIDKFEGIIHCKEYLEP